MSAESDKDVPRPAAQRASEGRGDASQHDEGRATPGSAMRRVSGALEARTGFRPTKHVGHWRCPAHDDHDPSLTVTEADDGVLIHCHAGCSTDAIVAKLGLTLSDLFNTHPRRPRGRARSPGKSKASYEYQDADGCPVLTVHRSVDPATGKKRFRQTCPDGSKPSDLREKPLYRLPEILKAKEQGKRILVVEGEKDVHTLEREGQVATTNPGGAGKWRSEHTCWLAGATVTVIADRDEPGRKHARQVAAELQAAGCDVSLMQPAVEEEKADVTDHIEAGRSLADLERLDPGAEGSQGSFDLTGEATAFSASSCSAGTDAEPSKIRGEAPPEPKDATAASSERSRQAQNVATQLVDLIRCDQNLELFVDLEGNAFVSETLDSEGRRTHELDGRRTEEKLSGLYYRHTGRAPSQQAVKEAIATLREEARSTGIGHLVHLRVAGDLYLHRSRRRNRSRDLHLP